MRPRIALQEELPESSLGPIDPAALLRSDDDTPSPVLKVILERVRSASRPRSRTDGHVVSLVIEGGGMRGAVSSGMCVVLEAAGLVPAFDRIYGVSAGALNGAATAVGQAALGATYYQDAASLRVINRMRPLVRRPVVDYDLLFDTLIVARKPLRFEGLVSGPDFRAVATSLETLAPCVMADFANSDELMQAVRASAALPGLGGSPPFFRGEPMTDGGLLQPIPFALAIDEGATHILVLRSRPAGYRKPRLGGLGESFAVRKDPRLVEVLVKRHGAYNRQAADLARAVADGRSGAHVAQVAVPDRTRLVGRLEANSERVVDALRLGARAMAAEILVEPIDLCWQPVVYRAAPSDDHEREPLAVADDLLRFGEAAAELSR